MAKDARGHGSSGRGVSSNAKAGMSLMEALQHSSPALWREGGGQPVSSNATAASELASGPKSIPSPVHDSMRHADFARDPFNQPSNTNVNGKPYTKINERGGTKDNYRGMNK